MTSRLTPEQRAILAELIAILRQLFADDDRAHGRQPRRVRTHRDPQGRSMIRAGHHEYEPDGKRWTCRRCGHTTHPDRDPYQPCPHPGGTP